MLSAKRQKANLITQKEYLMLKANLNEKIEKQDEMIESLKKSQNETVRQSNEFVEHF